MEVSTTVLVRDVLPLLLASTAIALVGLFVFFRRPDRLASGLLLVFSQMLVACVIPTMANSARGIAADPVASRTLVEVNHFGAIMGSVILFAFAAVFPEARFGRRTRAIALAALAAGLTAFVVRRREVTRHLVVHAGRSRPRARPDALLPRALARHARASGAMGPLGYRGPVDRVARAPCAHRLRGARRQRPDRPARGRHLARHPRRHRGRGPALPAPRHRDRRPPHAPRRARHGRGALPLRPGRLRVRGRLGRARQRRRSDGDDLHHRGGARVRASCRRSRASRRCSTACSSAGGTITARS